MRSRIQKLSGTAELTLILLLAFGPFVVRSTLAFLSGRPRVLEDRWSFSLVAYEVLVLALVAWTARVRGWSFRGLGLRPSWTLTGTGLLLYFAATITLNVVYLLVSAGLGGVPAPPMTVGSLSLGGIVLVSLVNPLYEEILVVGYLVRMTKGNGAIFAVTASALLRLLYHTYQGPIAAVYILPIGLMFAAVYVRYGELWPIVVAHAVMDFVGLTRLAYTG